MAQEQKHTRRPSEEEGVEEAAPQQGTGERKESLDDDIDSILGEIDTVLESNAEEFVKSFIQKGGQ